MAKIEIDLNDPAEQLRAVRDLLSVIVGDMPINVVSEPVAPVAATIDDGVEEDFPNAEAGAESTATPAADAAQGATATAADPAAATSDDRVDLKGVRFDGAFCGEAEQPFYGSGKTKGQWKKKRGVTEAEYNAWYAEQLADAATQEPEAEEVAGDELDASAAFTPGQQAPAATSEGVPQTAGEFMQYISERQEAGTLTQDQIGAAYGAAGLQVMDLFPPNPPEVVAANVAKLMQVLNNG